MKKIKFILVLFVAIISLLFVNKVQAVNEQDEWTDFSNVKISFKDESLNQIKSYGILFEDVTFDENGSSTYYMYMTHDLSAPNVEYENDVPKNFTSYINTKTKEATNISNIENFLVEYGDVYIWVLEYNYNNPNEKFKFVVNGEKIERPEMSPIGNRLKIYFFNNFTSLFCYEIHADITRKVQIKVGKVTDNSILKSIKNGDSDCLDKLMQYSKSNNDIYSKTIEKNLYKTSEDIEALAPKMGLTNDEYYYVYLYVDDENNKYVGIEDISLFQASVYKDVTTNQTVYNLFDYLSDDFKWNLEESTITTTTKEETKKEEEVKEDQTVSNNKKLPYTGKGTIIGISIIVLIGIIGLLYNKNKYYKGI